MAILCTCVGDLIKLTTVERQDPVVCGVMLYRLLSNTLGTMCSSESCTAQPFLIYNLHLECHRKLIVCRQMTSYIYTATFTPMHFLNLGYFQYQQTSNYPCCFLLCKKRLPWADEDNHHTSAPNPCIFEHYQLNLFIKYCMKRIIYSWINELLHFDNESSLLRTIERNPDTGDYFLN